jgi:hypothetical protein
MPENKKNEAVIKSSFTALAVNYKPLLLFL